MDGSQFAPDRLHPSRDTWSTPSQDPLPEREWSLSASQVVMVVLGIILACELIGVLAH